MTGLEVGSTFPEGVAFGYIKPSPEFSDVIACYNGAPGSFDASKEFKDKKVVLVAVPGAFTPTCTADHVPPFLAKLPELRAKGVDHVVVIAYNDPYVMNAWAKALGIKDESVQFMSDDEAKFSQSIGWTWGNRTARYAAIIDHGKVTYAEMEPGKGVTVSGVDAVLAKL